MSPVRINTEIIKKSRFTFTCVCGYSQAALYESSPEDKVPNSKNFLPNGWKIIDSHTVLCARCATVRSLSDKEIKNLLKGLWKVHDIYVDGIRNRVSWFSNYDLELEQIRRRTR